MRDLEKATRWGLLLLIGLAVVVQGNRVTLKPRIWSANDRSRWSTVVALVHHGTYVIARRRADGGTDESEPTLSSVDRVINRETGELTSDKLPLLPTLVAAEYAVLHAMGMDVTARLARTVVIAVLMTFNVIPLFFYLSALALVIHRLGTSVTTKLAALVLAGFATFVTTFSVTLTNHTVAAYAAAVALWAFVEIEHGGRKDWKLFAVAGFFISFCVANDLPMGLSACALGYLLFMRHPRRSVLAFLGAAAIPATGFVVTNYLAYGQPLPWYGILDPFDTSPWTLDRPGVAASAGASEDLPSYVFHYLFGHHGLFSLSPMFLVAMLPLLRKRRHLLLAGALLLGVGVAVAGWRVRGIQVSLCLATLLLAWPPPRFRDTTDPEALDLVARWSIYTIVTVTTPVLLVHGAFGGATCGPRLLMTLTPFFVVAVARLRVAPRWHAASASVLALALAWSAYSAWIPVFTRNGSPWTEPWLETFFR